MRASSSGSPSLAIWRSRPSTPKPPAPPGSSAPRPERPAIAFTGNRPSSSDSERQIGFFACARPSASFRISTSMVLRPSSRSRSRMRASRRRTSELPTTGSSDPHRRGPALVHQAAPTIQQVGRDAIAARDHGDALSGARSVSPMMRSFSSDRPAAPRAITGDHLDARYSSDNALHVDIGKPRCLCRAVRRAALAAALLRYDWIRADEAYAAPSS